MNARQQQETLALLAKYRANLNAFACDCLKIRDKDGNIQLFPGFNSAQRYVHSRIEAQRAQTGRVRAIILKGRQQGISTYIAARYYRKATLRSGVGVYILTHEQAATDNLFKIVERFQIHNPLRPSTGTENAKELEFNKLDSSYVVATAGQKAGGRGRTISLFHGSEVAFWNNAQEHFASSVQTVPDAPGTEILLESTGNGAQGEFYERWQNAVAGVGDYIPIFVPWFWQTEYARPAPPDFEISDEPGDNGVTEREYAAFFNLTIEQLEWRRAKVAELRSVQMFDQEYPASPEMAFASADAKKSFILPIQVLRARKRKGIEGAGPIILGADPSGPGKDRFAVAVRQGPKLLMLDSRQMPETPEAVLWLKALIDEWKPDRCYVDLGNIGHAVFSYLKADEKYRDVVRGVNFGGTSQSKLARPKVPGPVNRRAEMWDRTREWLADEDGVKLIDSDLLQADLTGPRIKPTVKNDFYLESKDEMKKRGVRSPDLADALVLTFAELERIVGSENRRESTPLPGPNVMPHRQTPLPTGIGGSNSWMGL